MKVLHIIATPRRDKSHTLCVDSGDVIKLKLPWGTSTAGG